MEVLSTEKGANSGAKNRGDLVERGRGAQKKKNISRKKKETRWPFECLKSGRPVARKGLKGGKEKLPEKKKGKEKKLIVNYGA